MRKYLCWLFGHSFICLLRWQNKDEYGQPHSEMTSWTCQHCGKQRHEQWDL